VQAGDLTFNQQLTQPVAGVLDKIGELVREYLLSLSRHPGEDVLHCLVGSPHRVFTLDEVEQVIFIDLVIIVILPFILLAT
jgi:hypothetical protein